MAVVTLEMPMHFNLGRAVETKNPWNASVSESLFMYLHTTRPAQDIRLYSAFIHGTLSLAGASAWRSRVPSPGGRRVESEPGRRSEFRLACQSEAWCPGGVACEAQGTVGPGK